MHLHDGVTGQEIILPFGWNNYYTANGRKYCRDNFMIAHSNDDVYYGYSTYTRTHSEYPHEFMSARVGQEDVIVMRQNISGGGSEILTYNVLYDDFVYTSLGAEYGNYFDIWAGGRTALIMTLPGRLLAFNPHADTPTDIEDDENESILLPKDISLQQNYPNPFNPSTVIKYSLPSRLDVTVSVYNLLGRRVKTLVEDNQPAGEYSITWDGTDEFGHDVASGIYFYQIKSNVFARARKMLLLK
jgi:hypothetical protein